MGRPVLNDESFFGFLINSLACIKACKISQVEDNAEEAQ